MPRISIGNNKVKYDFEIHGKYTIIKGDSGTGKTTLCDLIALAEKRKNSGIINNSNCELHILPTLFSDFDISKYNNCVFFVDESSDLFETSGYEKWLRNANCYFVFITRKYKLNNLPISVDSIYNMKCSGKYHTLEHIDSRFKNQKLSAVDCIIVEDSNSGFDFISQILKYAKVNTTNNIILDTAKGNTKFILKFNEYFSKGYRNFVFIYDAAGFGMNIEKLKHLIYMFTDCNFFIIDWESFEHYILASQVFRKNYTLDDAGCLYESLEQFSTDKLKQFMPSYHKRSLTHCLKVSGCAKCNNKCNIFEIYDFKYYIYSLIEVLYKYLVSLRSISYVATYNTFLRCNKVIKATIGNQFYFKIKSVDFKQNKCIICDYNKRCQTVSIVNLVNKVLTGCIYISNPSVLKNWIGFDKESRE